MRRPSLLAGGQRWFPTGAITLHPALDGGPRHAQLPSHLLLGSALLDYGGDGSLAQGFWVWGIGFGRLLTPCLLAAQVSLLL